MKVEQKTQFRPVTITLETQRELDTLVYFLGNSAILGTAWAGFSEEYKASRSYFIGTLWKALRDVHRS